MIKSILRNGALLDTHAFIHIYDECEICCNWVRKLSSVAPIYFCTHAEAQLLEISESAHIFARNLGFEKAANDTTDSALAASLHEAWVKKGGNEALFTERTPFTFLQLAKSIRLGVPILSGHFSSLSVTIKDISDLLGLNVFDIRSKL